MCFASSAVATCTARFSSSFLLPLPCLLLLSQLSRLIFYTIQSSPSSSRLVSLLFCSRRIYTKDTSRSLSRSLICTFCKSNAHCEKKNELVLVGEIFKMKKHKTNSTILFVRAIPSTVCTRNIPVIFPTRVTLSRSSIILLLVLSSSYRYYSYS